MASTDLTQKAYENEQYINVLKYKYIYNIITFFNIYILLFKATFLFFETENVIFTATHGIDFYNVLLPINITKPTSRSLFGENFASTYKQVEHIDF